MRLTDYGLGSYILSRAVCLHDYREIVLRNFMTRVGEGAIYDTVRVVADASTVSIPWIRASEYVRVYAPYHMIDFSFMLHVQTRVCEYIEPCANRVSCW